MKLIGLYLFNYTSKKIDGCQLSIDFNNVQLNELGINSFSDLNTYIDGLKSIEKIVGNDKAFKPYRISYDEQNSNLGYPEKFIEEVNKKRDTFREKDIDNVYIKINGKKSVVPYEAVMYVLSSDDKKQNKENFEYIYLFRLNKMAVMTNHKFFLGNISILNTVNHGLSNQKTTVLFGSPDELLSLPTSKKDCIAVLKRDIKNNKNTLGILKPRAYNVIFRDLKKRMEIVEGNLKSFQNKEYKIAGKIIVDIQTSDKLLEEIKNNDDLLQTLEKYRDNKNRKIKKISPKSLKDVLNELKDNAKGTARAHDKENYYALYYQDNVPELKKVRIKNGDVKNKEVIEELIVTEKTLPVFAALLDNDAIKRILSGTYEIPYFQHRKYYKELKKGSWIAENDFKPGKYTVQCLKGKGHISIKEDKSSQPTNLLSIKDSKKQKEAEVDIDIKKGQVLVVDVDKVELIEK